MGIIKNYNEELEGIPTGSGLIDITGAEIDDLIAAGFMDSTTIPSPELLSIQEAIREQLHTIWSGDPTYWDTNLRRLGGGLFVCCIWREVE